jgi:hypothetical protein
MDMVGMCTIEPVEPFICLITLYSISLFISIFHMYVEIIFHMLFVFTKNGLVSRQFITYID